MNCSFFDSNLSEDLLRAIDRRGYEMLTPIQWAVLQADSTTADLRITSITGSGKTLAIGFALRDIAKSSSGPLVPRKGPLAIIIVPTRELAKQVQSELSWLFAERKWRVESLTGGTSIRDERCVLAASPTVIVATPGRLLDHLRHGAIETEQVAAVVLDEADRMLDMGFQEDLQAILETMPSTRQTHMASATFCDAVGRLANRYQRNAIMLRGEPQGQVNEDIDHIVHLVHPGQKFDAIVNLLLENAEDQAIIFTRMRVDVTAMTRELGQAGFQATSLSGEMAQPARDRALATFRRGSSRVLVATDVAARGLDIQGVTQIIHLDPPTDPDSYVHRSGRTGRAGKKGTSRVLVVPAGLGFVKQIMRRAGTKFRVLPIPTAESLLSARDQRLFAELAQSPEDAGATTPNARQRALAERLCGEGNVVELVSRLLTRVDTVGIAPRQVRSPRVEEERRPDFVAAKRGSFGKRPAAPLQNTQQLQKQQQTQKQQQLQKQQQPQKQQVQMQPAWQKKEPSPMNRRARRQAQFAAQPPA